MKYSIITASYNSNKFIKKTISKVLEQKDVEFEYIIVDGGSIDGTVDIISSFASRDNRIRWISERDKGIADAMNKGIRMATGDIVAHIHSDDFYPHPYVLKNVAASFSKETRWATGGMIIVDENDEVLDEIKVKNFSYNNLLKGNSIYHPSTFISREFFNQIGFFDTSLKYAMDYDMWLRMGSIAAPVLLNDSLSCFRVHSLSLSTAYPDYAYSEAWMIRKGYLGPNIFKIIFEYYRFLNNRKKYIYHNESLFEK